jgi:hypothetical protein
MSKKDYIEDWLKKHLDGKTPEEAGLSEDDLKKLLNCYENGMSAAGLHLDSLPVCFCNICRS